MTFGNPDPGGDTAAPFSSKSTVRNQPSVSAETPEDIIAPHGQPVPFALQYTPTSEAVPSGRAPADRTGSGSGNMSDSPQPSSSSERGRSSGLNRPRSHSTSNRRPPARPSVPHPPQQQMYPIASSSRQHDIHNQPPGFHGSSPQYPSPPLSYDPRNSFVGPYAIPQQSMAHTPPPLSYPHEFPPGSHLQESHLTPHLRGGFQPMQPHVPVYSYPGQSPNSGGPSSHPSFSSGASPTHFSHHANPSTPSHPFHSSHSSIAQAMASHSSSYAAPSGQYGSLPFASSPSYPYPPQTFPTSPSYQPQYSMPNYPQHPQHFSTSTEQEGQGSWWYIPHNTTLSPPQYESAPSSYQGTFPVYYSHVGHYDVDPSYGEPGPRTSPLATYPGGYFGSESSLPSSPVAPSPGSSPRARKAEPTTPPVVRPKSLHERPIIRRSFHPEPPAHRSEWVMWIGNVPPDATHDELKQFLSLPPISNASESSLWDGGVLSIFLISRSSCAFINFESAAHLERAIEHFDGQQLRPNDSRCPRLVCRVRKKDDDLKAGVGGQRGMGVHTRWVKEKKEKALMGSPVSQPSGSPPPESQPLSPSDYLAANMSLSSDDDGLSQASSQTPRNPGQGSSSGSYASTNSSILTRHFPQRYFILKSLTQFDLDLSVQKGLWATQRHNEGILDQAFRTSRDVYLIFSVNKSGEFYGYARMSGPILQGEQRVTWAARTDSSPSSHSSISPGTGRGPLTAETIPEEPDSPSPLQPDGSKGETSQFFPAAEKRFVEQSPLPATSADLQDKAPVAKARDNSPPTPRVEREVGGSDPVMQSAPANLGHHRSLFSLQPPHKHPTCVDVVAPQISVSAARSQSQYFALDPKAPERAVKNKSTDDESPTDRANPEAKSEGGGAGTSHAAHAEDVRWEELAREESAREETWGESFKVDWICTDRLPFFRTRHIRNPWNNDREVKVSRDGTELEPSTGQKLLEEWSRLSEPQPLSTSPTKKSIPLGVPRKGGGSKLVPPPAMQ